MKVSPRINMHVHAADTSETLRTVMLTACRRHVAAMLPT